MRSTNAAKFFAANNLKRQCRNAFRALYDNEKHWKTTILVADDYGWKTRNTTALCRRLSLRAL
jgi:hypothetical protein